MKKQDIRKLYTDKVAELLAQGYTIFPDTMSGHQGEIAKIDLTNGIEILRVLLYEDRNYDRDGYWGDTVVLEVGKASEDTYYHSNWTGGTIWNNRLEVRSRIEWADIGSHWTQRHEAEWFTTLEEGARISRIRNARCEAVDRPIREELGEAYKSTALRWLRKQPRMKTCHLEDVEKMVRVHRDDGTRYFEIRAKGRKFTLGR